MYYYAVRLMILALIAYAFGAGTQASGATQCMKKEFQSFMGPLEATQAPPCHKTKESSSMPAQKCNGSCCSLCYLSQSVAPLSLEKCFKFSLVTLGDIPRINATQMQEQTNILKNLRPPIL